MYSLEDSPLSFHTIPLSLTQVEIIDFVLTESEASKAFINDYLSLLYRGLLNKENTSAQSKGLSGENFAAVFCCALFLIVHEAAWNLI